MTKAQRANSLLDLGNKEFHKRKFAAAVDYYRQAKELDPTSIVIKNNLAAALNCVGLSDEAISYLMGIIEDNPIDPRALMNLGSCYFDKREYTKALYYCNKALIIDPNSAKICSSVALTLGKLKRYAEGIYFYRRVLEIDADCNQAHLKIGLFSWRMNDFDTGIFECKVILRTDSRNSDAYLVSAICYLSRARSKRDVGDIFRLFLALYKASLYPPQRPQIRPLFFRGVESMIKILLLNLRKLLIGR